MYMRVVTHTVCIFTLLAASMCPCVKTGLTYLRPHRVLNADHSNAGEARENVGLIVPVRLSISAGEFSVGEADGP